MTIAMKPKRCEDCDAANPYLINQGLEDEHWVCEHRRACEARQMLARGESVEKAAAHAQGSMHG